MPILERDPWRLQYFENVACPAHVLIPTDDPDCWQLFPEQRWVYDKLQIAQSQNIVCGPHGILPERYPIFSKPNFNLKGMGVGSRVVASPGEMAEAYQPGHMWMELLEGEHVSTDCAVVDGKLAWTRHAVGLAGPGGTFHHWTIQSAQNESLETYLSIWILKNMAGYSGMMNFETIGGRIIEVHLRFADQWCDLYGEGWTEALVQLYQHGVWSFDDGNTRDGFSIPLFAKHGGAFNHPSPSVLAHVLSMPMVKSLQITFHAEKSPGSQPMPPGGFRLAVINATDLAAGLAARAELARAFPDVVLQL